MITDSLAYFSSAQAITAAAGSTNTLDLGAVRDIGEGEDLYVVAVVTTAFTDSSSDSTLTVSLEGDSTTSFTPDGTRDLFVIAALSAAGTTYFAKIAPGSEGTQFQYIRLKYTPNNGNLTTGSVTAFVTKDIAKYKAYAKNYTIS